MSINSGIQGLSMSPTRTNKNQDDERNSWQRGGGELQSPINAMNPEDSEVCRVTPGSVRFDDRQDSLSLQKETECYENLPIHDERSWVCQPFLIAEESFYTNL